MIHLHSFQSKGLVNKSASAVLTALLTGLLAFGLSSQAMAQSIVMSSTTSTEQSGLFAFLLPEFKKATGIDIKVVALGTGQALDMARRGDADVVFVHDQAAEEKFVAEGFGIKRFPVMYNDFVVVGPQADPANVKGNDIVAALKKSLQAKPVLSPAATRVAPMLLSCDFGHKPLWLIKKAVATKSVVAVWALR